MQLFVRITRLPDGRYVAASPALPEFVSEGGTRKEAFDRYRDEVGQYVAMSSDTLPDALELNLIEMPDRREAPA